MSQAMSAEKRSFRRFGGRPALGTARGDVGCDVTYASPTRSRNLARG